MIRPRCFLPLFLLLLLPAKAGQAADTTGLQRLFFTAVERLSAEQKLTRQPRAIKPSAIRQAVTEQTITTSKQQQLGGIFRRDDHLPVLWINGQVRQLTETELLAISSDDTDLTLALTGTQTITVRVGERWYPARP